ncbi:MAG: carboxypeptidase-like regulatory domain-containing protein [Bacteroidales bacterium]|nr:carboxypeptidase-like regulatory domain-containing protein [Bacteroidales bacterium]
MKRVLLLILLIIVSTSLFGQLTKIMGVVIDSISEEPLPFVNVQVMGSSEGATTGFDGKFVIKSKANFDSLKISYIGYKEQRIKIKNHTYQSITIKLQTSRTQLKEVLVHAKENPAHILLRKVIANKRYNSSYNLDAYEFEVYNKVQMDANNITESFKNRRSLKPFKFIFNNVDTSTINGKAYLPLLLTESISEIYFRKEPEEMKETIIASRASGIKNKSVSQFLGNMYQDINIYDNYMGVFGINFVSPIADFGLRTYRYYLIDSATIDGHWCYQIMFKPKRKQEATFTGEIWITDTTFAVKTIDMKINKVNINFVNAMSITQDFQLVDNKYWMLKRDNFVIDFNVIEKSRTVTGFFGHKTSIYRNIKINQERPDKDYKSNVAVNVDEDAWDKPREFWDSTRFEDLNDEESKIYTMVDTVINMPAFRNLYDMVVLITTGYYKTDYFDYGPFTRTFSYNGVEGARFRIGGRTSNIWNDKFRIYGHLAYGTLDKEFKYGIGIQYILKKNPRRAIDIGYKNDMEQLGASVRAIKQDNIISSIFRTDPNLSLTMVEQYKGSFMYEYFNGFSNTLTFRRRNIFPLQDLKFEIYSEGNTVSLDNIVTSEIELKTHIAYKEVFFVDKFNRKSIGTKYPRINIFYAYGIPNLFKSQLEYHKVQVAINQKFNIGSIGYTKYIVSWGKIWGQLPYPILEVHPGNETWIYDDFAFNRMGYYEFISDEYFMANITHNFRGLLFNHIPLMRKLKWREVIYGKVLLGHLSQENQNYSKFPSNTSLLTEPYYEVGVAIENIFKLIRIDASWRLSYLQKDNISPFGIMGSLRVNF